MHTKRNHFVANRRSGGFALITTLMFMGLFLIFLASFMEMSKLDLQSTGSSSRSTKGFFAAEAGLNLRATGVRAVFVGYNVPSGVSPTDTDPCIGSNQGTGDYRCISYSVNERTVRTYVREEPGNPVDIKIPVNERYGGLSAQEFRYTAISEALNSRNLVEARLELTFRSRLVPMFQFAAFYNKDLEILPGPQMNLSGPVHTNGDLYMNAETGLTIRGKVTTARDMYRGRKNENLCNSTNVSIFNPTSAIPLINSCTTRRLITPAMLVPYNGEAEMRVPAVLVPEPEALDPIAGKIYWDRADVRLVLSLGAGNVINTTNHPTGIEVQTSSGAVDVARTNALHACTSAASTLPGSKVVQYTNTLFNRRENANVHTLVIDMRGLLDCIHTTSISGQPLHNSNRGVDDTTEGGLVIFTTVKGPNSGDSRSLYGVRVRNGRELKSSIVGAPLVKGITMVTDQAQYVQGHYNSPVSGNQNRLPASFLCDTFQVLSNAWPAGDYSSGTALSARVATPTTVNAAVLSGTDTTAGIEGAGGQNQNNYNGGLENYPRFLENWSGGVLFTYRGSFVSLNQPRRSTGAWDTTNVYNPPNRDWDYDINFNNASKLPPLSPRFVYLRQELFVRDFGE